MSTTGMYTCKSKEMKYGVADGLVSQCEFLTAAGFKCDFYKQMLE